MTARSGARRRPALATLLFAVTLTLVGSWLAPVAGLGSAMPALAAATDLTVVTDTLYDVQPANHRVRVTMDVTIRNNTRETKARRFFFDHAFLAVQPTASNVKASGARGARAKIQKATKDSALLRLDFGGRLYSGKSRTMRVTFDLVDNGRPADRAVRVGPSLVTLPVWAHASNGAKGGSVTVRVPSGYDVAVEKGSFDRQRTTADGSTELSSSSLAKPLDFFAYVTAQQPATYVETPLDVTAGAATIPLTMRAWADDKAWATRVGDLFNAALPALTEQIGLPWPHADRMVVQEGASGSADGYAGLFDPAGKRIEVAYWANPAVVVHEAAHGWFNGSLLGDRWANEGFASLFAGRVAATIGEKATPPQLTDALKAAAIPLNAWAPLPTADATGSGTATTGGAGGTAGTGTASGDASTSSTAAAQATESYGYAASLALATAIAERTGDDALRRVFADAAGRIGAYQPVAPTGTGAAPGSASTTAGPETVDAAPDWRGLLDLLEAETGKDFTDLWRTWVVRPGEAPLLDARATALASYQRTLALADGWALPRSIRDALRAWQFDAAEQLMADARTVLAQRGALRTLAGQQGITLPDDMRTLFEAGRLADASARAEAERNAILAIAGAVQTRSQGSDPLTAIGMIGANPEADLASARASLGKGDVDASLASADDAYRGWNEAWSEGRRRALLLVAVLATILVLGSALVGRARRSGRSGSLVAETAAAPDSDAALAVGRRSDLSVADPEPTPEELLAAAAPPVPGSVPASPPVAPHEPG